MKHGVKREVKTFAKKLDRRLELIAGNPRLFPLTAKRKSIRRSVLTGHTVIIYKTEKNTVIFVALFDPRQNPSKSKLY